MLGSTGITYNAPSFGHTFNVNSNSIFFIGEEDIQVQGNIVSIAGITTIGNMSCATLGGISMSNYITSTNMTDNSIGDIVLENICYNDVGDQRLMMTASNTFIKAPTNLYMKINGTTVGTLTSTDFTLVGNLTASNIYNKTEIDDLLTGYIATDATSITLSGSITAGNITTTGIMSTSSDLYATNAYITGFLAPGSITGYYNSTDTDTLLDAKQDTSTSLTNLIATATALCQYSGHLTVNEIQVSEPTEALRVSGDTNLDGDVNITGALYVNSYATSPFFCCGKVNSSGTKVSSYGRIGFTSARTTAGTFTITFDSEHSSADYVIQLCVNAATDTGGRTADYASAATTGFTVYIRNGATEFDRTFMFSVYP